MQKRNLKLSSLKLKADGLFEIAWEAGHKVGGIYTVLASKALRPVSNYGRSYYLVGPYLASKLSGEFKAQKPSVALAGVFRKLKEKDGIVCHFGKWLVKAQPQIILIDFQEPLKKVDDFKGQLWQDFKIDSWGAAHDFNEPVAFSYAAGRLLEELSRLWPAKKMVAHFHEWLSGAGLLYLKKQGVKLATVFTTHATTLGRTLAFHSVDFYPSLDSLAVEEEVLKYQIKAKHQLEKAAALNCDVFTTVSRITAKEAEKFLGRAPEIILPNGLEAGPLLSFNELLLKHRLQRGRLKEFVLFYFFPYYGFDLEKTFFFFISGRYEIKAKGIDVFIGALSKLNKALKKDKSKKTIIAFFWVPAEVKAMMPQILQSRELLQDVKDSLLEISPQIDRKLLEAAAAGKKLSRRPGFSRDFLFELNKKISRIKKEGLPPLCTHQLSASDDPILRLFQEAGLENKPADRVKVVFYPAYLSGYDGLSNLNYNEAAQACHLGVFPSSYEPWGYTPLEAAALAVPAVTTDAAGFGRFCQDKVKAGKHPGVFVLRRLNRSAEQATDDLYKLLRRFCAYSRKQRAANRRQARKIAGLTDWKALYRNYLQAYSSALAKRFYEN